jgi:hypothetical protein
MRSILAGILALTALSTSVQAQAPDSLGFQGYVTNAVGVEVDTAGVSITFKLYEGSSEIWSETQPSVKIAGGIFNVLLGSVTPLDTVRFDRPLLLGIKVGGDLEISPRTPLTAAAYARALPGLYTFYRDDGTFTGYNVVGGAANNFVGAGVVGATIGGGGGHESGAAIPDTVLGDFGTVGGGAVNKASGAFSTVGGGSANKATGSHSAIAGGARNVASSLRATVGGGHENVAGSSYSTVGGGLKNVASYSRATVGGGEGNVAGNFYSTVGGGQLNVASATRATVGGGLVNTASGDASAIGGGWSNTASGHQATVPGGAFNRADGDYSFAAGFAAAAMHHGSFVWNDRSSTSINDSLVSTDDNQFLIRATGGVGIGTNSPSNQLTVSGDADVTGKIGVGDVSPRAMVTVRGPNHATDGPIMFMYGDGSDQSESGRIRFVEGTAAGTNRGAYIHYDGSANRLHVGTVNGDNVDTNSMTINRSTRFVGLGVDPTQRLHVNGNALADAHTLTSDARLKENVATLENALDIVGSLRGVRFDWKEDMGDLAGVGSDIGVIAQEVAEVVPEVVHETESGFLTVDYAKLVPVLIEAINAQQAEIAEMQATMERAGLQ